MNRIGRLKFTLIHGPIALGASLFFALAANGDPLIRYVKPGGTGDGTSWTNAAGNPQDILGAVSNGDDVQIWCAAGTYVPTHAEDSGDVRTKTFRMKQKVKLYGGFFGTESATNGLALRDPYLHQTILSGDLNRDDEPNFVNRGDNCYHVILVRWFPDPNPNCGFGCQVINITDSTIVDGFMIRGGAATGTGGETLNSGGNSDAYGGGVLVYRTQPVFQNCRFTDNLGGATSMGGGGGGHTEGSGGFFGPGLPGAANPVFISCSFDNNKSNRIAGAMCVASDYFTAINCAFSHNTASIGGGGVHNPYMAFGTVSS